MTSATLRSVHNIARLLGLPETEFITAQQQYDRREQLDEGLRNWVAERDTAECLEEFARTEVVASRVFDAADIAADPVYAEREDIVTVDDPDLGPVRMQAVIPHFRQRPGGSGGRGPPSGRTTTWCTGSGSDSARKSWPTWRRAMSSEASPESPAEVDAGAVGRPPLRSLLFVPGTRTDWLPKARAAGADAAILDLEDAVPDSGRLAARAQVADAVSRAAAMPAEQAGRMALFVRVNPLDDWAGAEELRAVVRPGLAGVVLPKVRCAQDVKLADRLLGWCEQEQGLPPGHIALVPLLETARGLREAYDIGQAASPHRLLGRSHRPRRRRGTRRRLPLEPRGYRNGGAALPRAAGRQGGRSAVPGQRIVDAHHRPAGAARLRRTEPLPRL